MDTRRTVAYQGRRDRVTRLLSFDHLTLFSIDSFFVVAFLIFSTILRRPRLAIRKMSTLPSIPDTDPSRCIFDSFRTAIARQVAVALPPLTPQQVYAGVDYGRKGEDFTIAIPRFKLPGKPDDLGKKVIENVSVPAWYFACHLYAPFIQQFPLRLVQTRRMDRVRPTRKGFPSFHVSNPVSV